jgi:hypothetical protein
LFSCDAVARSRTPSATPQKKHGFQSVAVMKDCFLKINRGMQLVNEKCVDVFNAFFGGRQTIFGQQVNTNLLLLSGLPLRLFMPGCL